VAQQLAVEASSWWQQFTPKLTGLTWRYLRSIICSASSHHGTGNNVVPSTTPHSDPDDTATPDPGSSDQLSAVEKQLRQLAEEVHVRGREIDEIQAMDKHRPWYRQVTSLVAIGALVVSLLSAVAGFQLQTSAETRAQSRERVQDRSDLRSILQRLIVLPIEVQELYTAYPDAAAELSRNVTSEYALLTGQAVEIIENLRKADNDDVSASEYNALATAINHLPGGHEEARIYYGRAADRANNLTEAITAVRSIAVLDYQMGAYEAMRAQFERAVEVTKEYPSTDFVRAETVTETYLTWAAHEIFSGSCVVAEQILDRAYEAATEEDVFTLNATLDARHQALLVSLSECVPSAAAAADGS
jgi:tetratricopeptide (TPR) repeat protein